MMGNKNAEYIPFLSETAILQQLKTTYMNLLGDVSYNYKQLGALSKSVFDHINRPELVSPTEAEELKRLSSWLSNRSYVIEAQDDGPSMADIMNFGDRAHEFLNIFNQVMQAHNLGFKIAESTDELGMLANILSIKPYWVNSYGVAISYKMDMLARFLVQRMADNWDNVILITGKRGIGKSTFAYALCTTISEYATRLYETPRFTVTKNIVFNDKKEDVFNKIKSDWKPFTPFMFDEAINQANARSWWLRDQQQLMELLTQVRYKRTTSVFLAPDVSNFDVVLRNQIAHLIIRVSDRGKAVVFAPPIIQGSVKDVPKMPIVQAQKFTDFLEKTALNRVMSASFYPIPSNNEEWTLYQKMRDTSVTTKDFINQGTTNMKERKEMMWRECLVTFPDDKITINQQFIKDFGVAHAFDIEVKDLARYIARSTGLSMSDVYFIKDDVQYINMANPVTMALKQRVKKIYGL